MNRSLLLKTICSTFIAVALLFAGSLFAHHSSQAQFGEFGSNTKNFEGRIAKISWGNPHITMDIEITGGDIPVGEKWRLLSHPTGVQEAYGFAKSDFAVGDTISIIGWLGLRDQPVFWPRAIKVNDGPMRSNLRFTDMIDIANGTFEAMNIQPPANLNGSPPARAGEEVTAKLAEMGLLDENGNVIWPPR
ncbi:MAG: hypothetical protein HOK55_05800 [Gammaproteobacteria bacterium]|nr:hypothetical protein [Gammaproteobacteria bacterium]